MKYLMRKLSSLKWKLISKLWYSRGFGYIGNNVTFINPMLIQGEKYISIGDGCSFRDGLRLEVVDPQAPVVIRIGKNVNIEQNVHIVARCSIKIEDNVSITGSCSIVDVVHPYEDIASKDKIGSRISLLEQPVSIGENSFIGYGVHINPGVRIGKHCVIGARSVVTKNIDDYCVAVGNPAKVIKKYNFIHNEWERV